MPKYVICTYKHNYKLTEGKIYKVVQTSNKDNLYCIQFIKNAHWFPAVYFRDIEKTDKKIIRILYKD